MSRATPPSRLGARDAILLRTYLGVTAWIVPLAVLQMLWRTDRLRDAEDCLYESWLYLEFAFVIALPLLGLIALLGSRRAASGTGTSERRPSGLVLQLLVWAFWLFQVCDLSWKVAAIWVIWMVVR
jgi:hypothetical protein